MSLITSPELFINIKRIPDSSSIEYHPFFKEEKKKIKRGVTINGIFIPGWLYWHINHWKIEIDVKDPNSHYIDRKPKRPDFRDNEWLISEYIHRAEVERKGLLILGSRQLGKSEFGASYMGRRNIIFKNTQNIIAGLSTDDLTLLLSKLNRGFSNVTPYFKPILILNNPKEILLGFRDDVSGERHIWAQTLVRNLEEGKNTGTLAGPTASSLLIDEVGKGPFLSSFIDAQPALDTPFGWRCTPIFTGTSGYFEKSQDLIKFFNSIEKFNFLCLQMENHLKEKIRFISGTHASRAQRKEIPLNEYLGKPSVSGSDKIKIKVVESPVNEVEKIKQEIKDLEVAGRIVDSRKTTMFYPTTEEELFLQDDTTSYFADVKPFAREHLAYLQSIQPYEEYGFMTRDAEGVPKFVISNKFPIQDFPCEEKEDKDAPITIWSHPIPGQQFGILHVAGSDPYNQEFSYWSSSLGTVYIFRRMYDAINGVFQRRFVASYAARPEDHKKWYQQVELLIEYYQATLMTENENKEIISYFDNRHKGHWLEDGLQLSKELNPHTKNKRVKGLSAAPANIKFGNALLKAYCLEDIVVNYTPEGEPIIKKGVTLIPDKVLLIEIIKHNDKSDNAAKNKTTNVDRIVGARHALICANSKDKLYPNAAVKPETNNRPKPITPKAPFNMSKGSGAFRSSNGPFRGRL